MRLSDDSSRRSFLRLIGSCGAVAFGGCVGLFEESHSFDSAHTEYVQEPLLTPKVRSGDNPYETALITDQSQLRQRLRLDTVSEEKANEWRAVDFSASFLAVFTSKFAVLRQGELRREVIGGEVQDQEFVFEISRSKCLPKVSALESWAVRFILIEQWSQNGNPAPTAISVSSKLFSQC